MTNYHLYLHTPTPVFKARVNLAGAITYPIIALPFDGVSLGAYTDIDPSMTLLLGTAPGLDDLGRVRVKLNASANSIPLPRTARGVEDGTLDVRDDAHITVLDDWRIWAKIPYFDLGDDETPGVDYKDGNIPAGDYNTEIPPVANSGPGFAGYIDTGTEVITVTFPQGGIDLSYPMADGATIATYAWDVQDGTITVGTSASDVITATFPAGFRWVRFEVTDSNGKSHTTRCPVLAIDPANDLTLRNYQLTQRMEESGQTLDIQLSIPLNRDDYPDGTLVMLWWDEAASPSDRDHMKFIGWLDKENSSIGRSKQGITRSTTLHCVDVAGRLKMLPGFPQALEREESDSPWAWMPSLDMNKALHYLLFWHSSAMDVVDFFLPSDGDSYNAMRLDANGSNLFDQVNSQAQKMVPDHYLVCNSQGQLEVMRDWMLDDSGDRPITGPVLTENLWSDLSFDYSRHPKVHMLRSGAVLSSTDWVVVEGEDTLPLVFSIAPGDAAAFSQGTSEVRENEGLALSQDDLNKSEGHRYALLNSRYGLFNFSDPTVSGFWTYQPAYFTRIGLNVSDTYASFRNLETTQLVGRVKQITVNYKARKQGTSLSVAVTFQKEESGAPALTYNPETGEVTPVPYTPPPLTWIPPLPDDPDTWYDPIKGYLLWDGAHVMRTWNVLAASPTWELVDTGITGDIYSAEYVHVDDITVGVWLLTSDGVWWCASILAETPSWENVLSLAEMQAVVPTTGGEPTNPAVFKAMATYGNDSAYCIVACGPDNVNTAVAYTYNHIPFMHTHDYGATWTYVDPVYDQVGGGDMFSEGTEPNVASYCGCGLYALTMFRSSPTIFAFRSTPNLQDQSMIMWSEDGGHVWDAGWGPPEGLTTDGTSDFSLGAGFLRPYPSISDNVYLMRGNSLAGEQCHLIVGSGSALGVMDEPVKPVGYEGGEYGRRPNQRTGVPSHVIALWRHDSTNDAHILESEDAGETWSLLYDTNSPNSPINTPNGWPPNIDVWFMIRTTNASGSGESFSISPIQFTDDRFESLSDKQGNLYTLLSGTWVGPTGTRSIGFCDGFALPKVGVNA